MLRRSEAHIQGDGAGRKSARGIFGRIARHPLVRPLTAFTHLKSPRGPLPQLAGEGGAKRRMGCGPPPRPWGGLHDRHPEPSSNHSLLSAPHPALRATFPAPR